MSVEYERIQAIYARIPDLHCKGLCHASCGVIVCQSSEYAAIEALGPIPEAVGLTCPLLANNRCSRYDVRPLICRLWGQIKQRQFNFRCPHGCRPKRWLTDEEARALVNEARDLDPDTRVLGSSFLEEALRKGL